MQQILSRFIKPLTVSSCNILRALLVTAVVCYYVKRVLEQFKSCQIFVDTHKRVYVFSSVLLVCAYRTAVPSLSDTDRKLMCNLAQ